MATIAERKETGAERGERGAGLLFGQCHRVRGAGGQVGRPGAGDLCRPGPEAT